MGKIYGSSNSEIAHSIRQTHDGGYIVAGETAVGFDDGDITGVHGGSDYWIVKLDASGNLVWEKCFGGSSGDIGRNAEPTADGGYILAGTSGSNDGDVSGNHGSPDFWVVKTDSVGNIEWQKCFGGMSGQEQRDIKQTADGGYIITGIVFTADSSETNYHGLTDYWIVKTDITGNFQWQNCYGGSSTEVVWDIEQTYDGGYAAGGCTYSHDGDVIGNHSNNDFDYWIVKLAPDLLYQAEISNPVTQLTGLMHDGVLNVAFTSASEGIFFLNLEDMTGRILYKHRLNAVVGTNQMEIPVNSIANGIYMITLWADDGITSIKVVKNR